MPRTEGEIVIDRPPDQVFDYVADERNIYDPRTVRAEKLSAGPIGVGTRFRTESKAWVELSPWSSKSRRTTGRGGSPLRRACR